MLKDKGTISKDIILMVDEMYLQKCIQYAGGQYIGADSNKKLLQGHSSFYDPSFERKCSDCGESFT